MSSTYLASIGIDPGLTGAIAVVDSTGFVYIEDMPTTVKSVKRRRNRAGAMTDYPQLEVDGETLQRHLQEMAAGYHKVRLTIEKVGAVYRHDKQTGVAAYQPLHATFVFGEGAGVVRGVSECVLGRRRVARVSPITWKKYFNLIGTEKDAARLLAQEKISEFTNQDLDPTTYLRRKKDIGRADAFLVALYGLRKHGDITDDAIDN